MPLQPMDWQHPVDVLWDTLAQNVHHTKSGGISTESNCCSVASK
jgi:hypothetical protein